MMDRYVEKGFGILAKSLTENPKIINLYIISEKEAARPKKILRLFCSYFPLVPSFEKGLRHGEVTRALIQRKQSIGYGKVRNEPE